MLRNETGSGRASAAVVAASFGLLCLIAFAWPGSRGGATDFRSFYAGAKLAGTPHLYLVDHVRAIQREYADPREVKAFTRPPFYALMLWPLGRLPYGIAHLVWQALNLAALAGFLLLWLPRPASVVLCCWFFPLWVNFMAAQDMPLVLFLVALSAYLLRKNRDVAAGLVLALCSLKFHLFLLLPVLIAAKRLWRFAGGLLAGGAALAGVSVAVAGPDWPQRQFALVQLSERGEASQAYMPNLNGLFHAAPGGAVLLAVSTLAVAVAAWHVMRRVPLGEAVAAMLCAGLLVGLHGFLYDCAILLPFFLSLAARAGMPLAAPLWIGTGVSTIALTQPSVSFIGQLALVLLFCFVVYDASQRERP